VVFENLCNNVLNMIAEMELRIEKYPEIFHTMGTGDMSKNIIYV
jgi:hypothetical protein